jgi:hypothetical protein
MLRAHWSFFIKFIIFLTVLQQHHKFLFKLNNLIAYSSTHTQTVDYIKIIINQVFVCSIKNFYGMPYAFVFLRSILVKKQAFQV